MSKARTSRISKALGISLIVGFLVPSAAVAQCRYTTMMTDRQAEHYLDKVSAAVDQSNDFLDHAAKACASTKDAHTARAAGEFLGMLSKWSKVPEAKCQTVPDKYALRQAWIGLKGLAAMVKLEELNNQKCR
jgi:hypothetical protein